MASDEMRDEMTHVLRGLNEVLNGAAFRPKPTCRIGAKGTDREEIDRLIALARYHAEQLGDNVAEIAEWLASGTTKRRISQSRPRGKERSPRAIRE